MSDHGDPRRFPETHWSQLLELGDASDPRHLEHLNQLLKRYWKPTYHYVRAMRFISDQDAEDLTQGFFAMVLARVDFAALSPERGSFRGFLKTALRRFVVDQERKRRKDRRDSNDDYLLGAGQDASPEEAFDKAWAHEVLAQALERLRSELEAEGRAAYYEVFRQYRLEPSEGVSYESLARQHGIRPEDVRNYLRFVRTRGRGIIRNMLRDYLFPSEDIEDELRFILSR